MTPIHHSVVHTKPFSLIPLFTPSHFRTKAPRWQFFSFLLWYHHLSSFLCCCSFFILNPSSSSQFSCYFSFYSFFFVMCQLIVNLFRLLLLFCFSRCFSTMLFQRAVCRCCCCCCSSSLDIRYNYENVYNILPCFFFFFLFLKDAKIYKRGFRKYL